MEENMGAERQYTPVVIIGAGFSGLVSACNLRRKLGFEDYIIFERNADLGGTWFSNCCQ
jgi:cation diffusion facilitator CzcD-associated flavoprotein CzcO